MTTLDYDNYIKGYKGKLHNLKIVYMTEHPENLT